MKLIFVGTGYVGLVSGAMLAYLGHEVCCMDRDKRRIENLKNGKMPIYEPGLNDIVNSLHKSKKLSFINSYSQELYFADAVFITVGTPSLPSGEANLEYVKHAAMEAAKNTCNDTLIIIKSTIIPGTTKMIEDMLRKAGFSHMVACNPEFLREGSAIKDFVHPDRIVVGNIAAKTLIEKIYVTFLTSSMQKQCSITGDVACHTKVGVDPYLSSGYGKEDGHKLQIFFTDTTTAELIKYASNSLLATKIAFINEMSNLCEQVGGDIDALSLGIGLDKRIGKDFLKVGPGFGGSCFPKDILALEQFAKIYKAPCYILSAVIESNINRKYDIVVKITEKLGNLEGKKLVILGLTFKAGTDDIRSSAAIDIIKLLLEKGCNIFAYDPCGMDHTKSLRLDIELADNYIDASKDADAIVILTEWPEFQNLDYVGLSKQMKQKIIFDYRNILNENSIDKSFTLYQLGKKYA